MEENAYTHHLVHNYSVFKTTLYLPILTNFVLSYLIWFTPHFLEIAEDIS